MDHVDKRTNEQMVNDVLEIIESVQKRNCLTQKESNNSVLTLLRLKERIKGS